MPKSLFKGNNCIIDLNSNSDKELLKESLQKGGFTGSLKCWQFMKMKFNLEGNTLSGQTILRNFGLKKRTTENLRLLCNYLDIDFNHFANQRIDYSDPEIIRKILTDSQIKLDSIKFSQFKNTKIVSDLFEGRGINLIKFYNFAKAIKEADYSNNKQMLTQTRFTKKDFVNFINELGIINRYYSSFLEDRKFLRELLNSSGFDFETQKPSLIDFLKMKFKFRFRNKKSINGEETTIKGQWLLIKCFGSRRAVRLKYIQKLLNTAGFNTQADIQKSNSIGNNSTK